MSVGSLRIHRQRRIEITFSVCFVDNEPNEKYDCFVSSVSLHHQRARQGERQQHE